VLVKRLLSLAVLAASLAAVAITADPADAARKSSRLKAFTSCSSLVGYANRFAPRSAVPVFRSSAPTAPQGGPVADAETGGGSDGGGSGTTAPAPQPAGDQQAASAPAPAAGRGTDFSGTNTQEENVDEPDVVKTDGSTVFAVANRKLHAVDVSNGAAQLVSSVDLPADAHSAELLISGKRALLMWTTSEYGGDFGGPTPMPIARPASSMVPGALRTETVLAEVDISDPAAMKIVRSATIDGRLVTSRLNGSTARVITAATPRALEVPVDYSLPVEQQRAAMASAGSKQARKWLPRRGWRTGVTAQRRFKRAVACDDVRRPAVFSGLDMVTVLTLDLSKGITPVDSDALMTDAETVYASDKSLYIGTRKWIRAVDAPLPEPGTGAPPAMRTQLHKFDISDSQNTSYKGSGDVSGYLLNQFSLSEHEGVLRAATTDGPSWWPGDVGPQSESAVTTLETKGGALATLGRVGGLGKGERIYAVRFIGPTGYVVTFRQTDPLYTIDVSKPASPRVVGELKILGYSAYLHPVAGDLLIGVGQDATEEGRRLGAQISLFDVSNPANPTRLHQLSLGEYASSSAEYDHHAFLYWPATNLLMLPVNSYSGRESFSGAVGFRVKKDTGIQELARISHPGGQDYLPQVERSMVIGDRVFTLSALGLKASRLDTLADAGWVAFPTP
jgi:uncharacterized secreted protein with C-terminal beta-propeller domain